LALPLLLSVASAGCSPAALHEAASSYRCFPTGRYPAPGTIMDCVGSTPQPGDVLELDLTPWEYSF
jgi:hypothetical protein